MAVNQSDFARIAADMKRDVLEDIAQDPAAPPMVAEIARVHLEKPWAPGYLTTLVSPLRATLRSHLKLSVVRQAGRVWYFPSFHWWRNHARHAHPPDGSGFSLEEHVRRYTEESGTADCIYADLLEDGRVRVLGEDDFKIEAGYWKANYKVE